MKNLITSIACIMILLAFILQFSQNQLLYNRMMFIDREADLLKVSVKQEGCPGGKAADEAKERICRFLSCDKDEVIIEGAREPAPKGEIITYAVKVPLGEIIVSPFFNRNIKLGNIKEYEARRFVVSEYDGDKP